MKCRKCKTGLIEYLQGHSAEKERLSIESHLNECSACRSFATYLKQTLQIIELEKQIETDPFLATRIEGILHQTEETTITRSRIPAFIPALAFSLVIMAGVFGGIGIGHMLVPKSFHAEENQNNISLIVDDMKQEPIESFLLGWN